MGGGQQDGEPSWDWLITPDRDESICGIIDSRFFYLQVCFKMSLTQAGIVGRINLNHELAKVKLLSAAYAGLADQYQYQVETQDRQ